MSDVKKILKEVDALAAARATNPDWLKEICALLQRERPHYNWVGLYFLEEKELVLGPFVGAPSPHTRIPLDQGICGAAVREGKTVIVPDVSADPRHLACSVETQSEIVLPIEHEGRISGEIDIDSHIRNAFTAQDSELLQQVAQRLAPVLAQEGAMRTRSETG
ncbi:GAF domain-containing protein [Acidobacteriia bacterium AH_259_A11_L15]|nr:GAF domain-containing protein [Acidobacteriia bacterium AH_259_A11_L15]